MQKKFTNHGFNVLIFKRFYERIGVFKMSCALAFVSSFKMNSTKAIFCCQKTKSCFMKNPQKCCILNAGLPPKFNQLASYSKQLWGGKQPIDMMMILTPHSMLPCLHAQAPLCKHSSISSRRRTAAKQMVSTRRLLGNFCAKVSD